MSGARPAITIIGTASSMALAMPVTASVNPGPAVTAQTAGLPVRRAQASAMCAAACSWRVSMTRNLCRRHAW